MPYASEADMIDAFGEKEVAELTDRANLGGVDSGVLIAALDAASTEIDSYIGGRYAVPVACVVSMLKTACLDIARYRLYDDALHEVADTRYARTMSFLRDVQAGRAVLLCSDGLPAVAVAAGAASTVRAAMRTLATNGMTGYPRHAA